MVQTACWLWEPQLRSFTLEWVPRNWDNKDNKNFLAGDGIRSRKNILYMEAFSFFCGIWIGFLLPSSYPSKRGNFYSIIIFCLICNIDTQLRHSNMRDRRGLFITRHVRWKQDVTIVDLFFLSVYGYINSAGLFIRTKCICDHSRQDLCSICTLVSLYRFSWHVHHWNVRTSSDLITPWPHTVYLIIWTLYYVLERRYRRVPCDPM